MIVINEIDLKECLKLFWRKKIFIILMVIISSVIGIVKVKYFTTPIYEASGKLICARSEESINEGTMITTNDLTIPSTLADTYAELIKSDLVTGQVIQNLELDTSIENLRKSIELNPVTKVYYQVTAKDSSNEKSAQIANEFMKVFSEEVKKFYEIDSIYIVDEAKTPQNPVNMNIIKTTGIFALVGFMIAAFIIMIIYALNSTVTNADQIKKYTKLSTLVTIPKYNGNEDLITIKDSKSPYAESIKILRTNLQYMYDKGNLQTVAITSSFPGEGKSWVTANLAVAFANTGKKTLIIDADMRRGRQHRVFKVNKIPGLSEYLSTGRKTFDMVKVKGKKVSKTLIAKILGKINKVIKIDKIPAIEKIIYKEDFITMNVSENTKGKALKNESNAEEAELILRPVKKKKVKKKIENDNKIIDITKKISNNTDIENEKDLKITKKTKKKVKKVVKEVENPTKNQILMNPVKEENNEEINIPKKKKVKKVKKISKENVAKKQENEIKEVPKIEENIEETKVIKKKKVKKIKKVVKKQENKDKKEVKINDYINETVVENLYVLPAGRETLESSELLVTGKLEAALDELKKEYDMIIIDTPPVSVVADGFVISRMVDTNMIVIKHGNTEIDELNKIKNNIQEIGGEIIGTVINKIPDANKKYYNTYYSRKMD